MRTKYVLKPMQNVLIAGGTGLIGSELKAFLSSQGYGVKLLSRKPTDQENESYNWDIINQTIDQEAFNEVIAVINLAGSSIIGGRWTKSKKQELRDSRIESTKLLTKYLNSNNHQVKHYIQGSAMGFYGDCQDDLVTEKTPVGKDFMAQLCADWETASANLNPGIKRTVLRIGLYLSKNGGVYKSLASLSKFYLASAFGNGKIWSNYTHRDEMNALVLSIITDKVLNDTYNVVGAKPFMMNDLVNEIAQNENRKVILPNVPSFMLKLVLGEASATLLSSYKITSPKLIELGTHKYTSLREAIQAL